MKKRILISYDYFYPAFKAGGPIQSLVNLVKTCSGVFDFYIITGSNDLGEKFPLSNVPVDIWIDFDGGRGKVIYLSNSGRFLNSIMKIVNEIKPDVLFLNNIFSITFTLIPRFAVNCPVILHSRGMLHPEALLKKKYKKLIYLTILKKIGFFNNLNWCVSDEKEGCFVKQFYKKSNKVWVVPNFPNLESKFKYISKESGTLKLITVALISPMKNHLLVIKALNGLNLDIQWDIYGPIKDPGYWALCRHEIAQTNLRVNIKYCGVLVPDLVNSKIRDYHVMIQPSESENFGHSLFQALLQGRPIITSNNTPWKNLEHAKAGLNVDIDISEIAKAIGIICSFNQFEFDAWVNGARKYAFEAIHADKILNEYVQMFNMVMNNKK